jgi:hypothetical protein
MKLPSFLDLAYLLSAIPYSSVEPSGISESVHEDFRLTLLAPFPPGLPTKPLGYLLLVYLAQEAMRRDTRELGASLGGLCRSLGAPELAERPKLVEEQLVRWSQTFVRIDIAGPKAPRTIVFPFFSQLVLEPKETETKCRWHLRLSGDFQRVLRHTVPSSIPPIEELLEPA